MAGQFKNAPIGFKPGMRFKTAFGWREVLAVRDGTAICWPVGGKAPDFVREYRRPTETMLLDLGHPWVGRQYKGEDGWLCVVESMADNLVFVRGLGGLTREEHRLDFFKKHFTPIPLESPFKVGEWAVYDGKMVGIEHYITDSMVMVEEIGSALPPFPVPVDRLRRPSSPQEQPTPTNDPACVRKYKGQKVVVIRTWGEWSWVAGEQSWKPFVVKTSDITQ